MDTKPHIRTAGPAAVAAEPRLARVRELPADLETPVSAYLKLRGAGPSFLLESVEGGERLGRYSFIGLRPSRILRTWRGRAELSGEDGTRALDLTGLDILDVLRGLLQNGPDPIPGLPRFTGGAVGYLGYDLVRDFERLPATAPDVLGLPEAVLLFCDVTVILDHVKHRLFIVSQAPVRGGAPAAGTGAGLVAAGTGAGLVAAGTGAGLVAAETLAEAQIDAVIERLRAPLPAVDESAAPSLRSGQAAIAAPGAGPAGAEGGQANLSREAYEEAVRRAKDYIAAGDIFQVVLSRRLTRPTSATPLAIYRALRRLNPSPYLFFLELPEELSLIGSSPEVLVRLEGRTAEVRPLAGTRPRGRDAAADEALARELLADPKERAEHVMLVDLARNDLGRVCSFGTVRVPTLMEVERYSHVMHIVSSVLGELGPGRDALDLLRATFPAGTVSGAPKVRAMEIIEELENNRRGPYAGAVGYFDYAGNMDVCIAIRTLVMRGQTAFLQAGAGIVADSDPVREYEETLNKLRAQDLALRMAEEGR